MADALVAGTQRHASAVDDPPHPTGAITREVTFTTPAGQRFADYYVPAGLVGPAPLVVALHGLSNAWVTVRDDSGLDQLADRHHFVVAYPTGLGGSWNAGTCCGYARDHHVDDVGFLDLVIARASGFHAINPDRVHLVGFSDGGMMVYRYACERSARVSSIAVDEASMVAPTCRPDHPMAVYAIHGGLDRTVPFLGCSHRKPGTGCANPLIGSSLPSIPSVLQRWLMLNLRACPTYRTRPSLTYLPTTGHHWPTLANAGFDGGAAVWAYFWSHPSPPMTDGRIPRCG